MSVLSLPLQYLYWHYSRGLRDLFGIWMNFMWFIGNMFSVKTLIRTLIQPLKLIQEEKGSFLLDPSRFAQNLLVNVIMRIVGAVTRTLFILVALLSWMALISVAVVFFCLWLCLPMLLVCLPVVGVFYLV